MIAGKINRLYKNSFYNSLSWGSNLLVNLLSITIIIRYLGAELYGIYILVTVLMGHFNLLDFGLGQAVTKYVSSYRATNSQKTVNLYINLSFSIQAFIATVFSIIILYTAESLTDLINVGEQYRNISILSIKYSAIGFFISMLLSNINSIIAGLQRYDILGMVNVISSTVNILVLVIVLLNGGNIDLAIMLNVVVLSFQVITLWVILHAIMPEYRFDFVFNMTAFKELFSFSSFLFISKVSAFSNNYLLRVIISAMINPSAVAIFSVPTKLINGLQSAFGSLAGVLFPYTSGANAVNEQSKIRSIFQKAFGGVIYLMTPLFVFMGYYSKEILAVWVGHEFADQANDLFRILIIAFYITSTTMVPVYVAMGLGKAKTLSAFSMIALITTLTSLPILIHYYGVKGASLAILFSGFQSPFVIWWVTKRLLKLSIRDVLKMNLYHMLGPLILTISAFVVLDKIIVVNLDNDYFFGLNVGFCYSLYLLLMRGKLNSRGNQLS